MYKYSIHERLRKLSYEDYQISWKFFPERLNVSVSTWKKWIYIKKNSSAEIPLHALITIATFFECTVSDLINVSSSENLKAHFHAFKSKICKTKQDE